AILIYDEPDAAALRDQYRQVHLDYLTVFDAQTLFAGPFTTDDESADLGSLRLIEFPDRAAAERHVAEEPYVLGGVQKRWHIQRWLPRLPYSWRDCPRTQGHIQAIFYGFDQPGSSAGRAEFRDAHEAYLAAHAGMVMARGSLVTDAGTGSIGSVLLLDVPDMDTARAFLEKEPFYSNGVYQEVNFHRWRFGRVMDRFK
ncbi:MAG TPA: YciI family protein, partial [Candidatus Tectomicrobia bacterium]